MVLESRGRTRVKICGVTNEQDARAAIALGADALGFNLFPGSKRCIDLEKEASWISRLPPLIARVAVVVNLPLDAACQIARHPAIDCIQLHGDEDEAYCAAIAQCRRPFIKALRLGETREMERAEHFSTSHILLDAHVPGAFGGTGSPIDIHLASAFASRFPRMCLILAGGLSPENVANAVRAVRPFAVDVASGVESEPRRKDAGRMADFIRAAAI